MSEELKRMICESKCMEKKYHYSWSFENASVWRSKLFSTILNIVEFDNVLCLSRMSDGTGSYI